jgi:3,5-epimerase/4-reductase
MKILVLGDGFIGSAISKFLGCSTSKNIEDVYDYDTIINAVGKTGRPNVDWCELHQPETVESNITFPIELAEKCRETGKYLVHIGSGCIYHDLTGKLIKEEQFGDFWECSFYSKTKLISELALSTFPNVLQLRIRMPIDTSSNPRNLLVKILKYKKVLDVQNSMTVLPDFLIALKKLIEDKKTGIYNMVNPGSISPFEIVNLYKTLLVVPDHEVEPLTISEMNSITLAARSNCVLSTSKLESAGIILPPIRERIKDILMNLDYSELTAKSPKFAL